MTTTNIQPGELMIGNYVLAPKSDEYDLRLCKIFEIRKKFFRVIEISTNLMFDQTYVKPIPLTEQWLLEFGLSLSDQFVAWGVKSNIKHVGITESVYLVLNDDEWRVAICEHSSAQPAIDDEIPAIQYVHQLQKLYFALTATPMSRKNGKGEV